MGASPGRNKNLTLVDSKLSYLIKRAKHCLVSLIRRNFGGYLNAQMILIIFIDLCSSGAVLESWGQVCITQSDIIIYIRKIEPPLFWGRARTCFISVRLVLSCIARAIGISFCSANSGKVREGVNHGKRKRVYGWRRSYSQNQTSCFCRQLFTVYYSVVPAITGGSHTNNDTNVVANSRPDSIKLAL